MRGALHVLLLLSAGVCLERPSFRGLAARALGLLDAADLEALLPGALATRETVLEQIAGVIRKPAYALSHNIQESELDELLVPFTFPTDVFAAAPLYRSNSSDNVPKTEPLESRASRRARIKATLGRVVGKLRRRKIPEFKRVDKPGVQVLDALMESPQFGIGYFYDGAPNYGLLLHSTITMSLATYSLCLETSSSGLEAGFSAALTRLPPTPPLWSSAYSDDLRQLSTRRAQKLVRHAIGAKSDVRIIQSSRACCVCAFEPKANVLCVAFRGTMDAVDLLTDAAFVPDAFRAEDTQPDDDMMLVHGGFGEVFDSLRAQLEEVLRSVNSLRPTLLFTGHSMGGALAQLAAAYLHDRTPWLVTFGAPAIGNAAFDNLVIKDVKPYGGLRVWNELDSVPYLARLAGYRHSGVPIKLRLAKNTTVKKSIMSSAYLS